METNPNTVEHPDGSTTTILETGAQVHTPAPLATQQPPAGVTPPARVPAPHEQPVEDEKPDLGELLRSITQREWLVICRALDCEKVQVMERAEFMFPAAAWVVEKRKHGGAEWDRILDLTDPQLLELIGLGEDTEVTINAEARDSDPTSPSGGASAPSSA